MCFGGTSPFPRSSTPVNVRTVTGFCADDTVQGLVSEPAYECPILWCGQTVHSTFYQWSHQCLADQLWQQVSLAVTDSKCHLLSQLVCHFKCSLRDHTTSLQVSVADISCGMTVVCACRLPKVSMLRMHTVIFVGYRFGSLLSQLCSNS